MCPDHAQAAADRIIRDFETLARRLEETIEQLASDGSNPDVMALKRAHTEALRGAEVARNLKVTTLRPTTRDG